MKFAVARSKQDIARDVGADEEMTATPYTHELYSGEATGCEAINSIGFRVGQNIGELQVSTITAQRMPNGEFKVSIRLDYPVYNSWAFLTHPVRQVVK